MTVRLSFIIGPIWLKLNHPDSGIWRFKTKHWLFTDKTGTERKQKRTDWYRIV